MRLPGLQWTDLPTGADLEAARRRARLSRDALASTAGRHPHTIARQERDRAPVDRALYWMAYVLAGACPWPGWEQWNVENGLLFPGLARRGVHPADAWDTWRLASGARALEQARLELWETGQMTYDFRLTPPGTGPARGGRLHHQSGGRTTAPPGTAAEPRPVAGTGASASATAGGAG